MQANVIDLYHGDNNGQPIDFAKIKAAGIVGIIHKCTQGSGYTDPAYPLRRQAALDAGLLWGAYTFNTGDSISSQVEEFLDHAEPDDDTLLALDFEDNPRSQMSLDQARHFLEVADAKLGRKIVLYSGNRIKDLLTSGDPFFGSHRLWLAQYGPLAKPQASWSAPWLWQFSESGRVPGISGAVDLNNYSGTNIAKEWAS